MNRHEPGPSGARPNIVVIVLDDLGFSDLRCFGSDIGTPVLDGLAAGGLRYTNFHVTPLCAPTRASLLTGRNHHAVGMGALTALPGDSDGYSTRIPDSAATVARALRDGGYGTYAVGKWHVAPMPEAGPAGPVDRWPLAMGFDRYYGFLGGSTSNWTPELVADNSPVDPPATPDEGYHLTEDLVDRAIRMIADQVQTVPDKPFFLYFATAAPHYPHQAPREWTERYRGRFDHGWDSERERRWERQTMSGIIPPGTESTERPDMVPSWESLSTRERAVYARQMEIYAGFLSHTDAQLGRLFGFLEDAEVLDDTVVLVVSDNGADGASATGRFSFHVDVDVDVDVDAVDAIAERLDDLDGLEAQSSYAAGWAWAGSTPFRMWKWYNWLGGVRVPLIVSWPSRDGVASRQPRRQFLHAVDVMPTLLDLAGIEAPEYVDGIRQSPLDGASFVPTMEDAGAASPRDTQYFEMFGSRAIYHDGWKATTDHVPAPDLFPEHSGSRDFSSDHWMLVNLEDDFSEARDVSKAHPDRVDRMVSLWKREAERSGVAPLSDLFSVSPSGRPLHPESLYPPRRRYLCFPGALPAYPPSPDDAGFRMTVEIESADGADSGVLTAHHARFAGWLSPLPLVACYLVQGGLRVWVDGAPRGELVVSAPLPRGRFDLSVDVREGSLRVAAGGTPLLQVPVELRRSRFGTLDESALYVGRGPGIEVDGYRPRERFTGAIRRVVYEVGAR